MRIALRAVRTLWSASLATALFFEVNAFDAGGDGGEDFVGNGFKPFCQLVDGEIGAEDLNAVAHLLSIDALNAVEEANNTMCEFLYCVEEEEDVEGYEREDD